MMDENKELNQIPHGDTFSETPYDAPQGDTTTPTTSQVPTGDAMPPETSKKTATPEKSPEKPPKKNNNAGRAIAFLLCGALVGGGAGVGGAAAYMHIERPQFTHIITAAPAVPAAVTGSNGNQALDGDTLYANNLASCVGVTISGTTTNIFGQISTAAVSGSGFVLTQDGYIVTNHHVIADAVGNDQMSIEVSFADGNKYTATLVGYESDNDVALLKIDATDLQAVVLGDSDQIVVGETVYAIGNPLGELTFSLTNGLISATDRLIATDESTTMNMLQTNAAINPGNSGGPLFNSAGQLIGINTAKYSNAGNGTSVEGLGFAIPINDVVNILTDLMDYGHVTGKPYAGMQVLSVSDEAQYYGVSAGAYVDSVIAGGAAEKAGLVKGDIITAIDDTTVDSSSALTAAITAYRAGDSAQLTVLRDNDTVTLTIVFDEKQPDTQSSEQTIETQEQESQSPFAGNGNMTQDDIFRYFFGW